jgi:L-ascorbate metabolism protein UlaG (beta-lactamase superfamily)
MTSLLHLSYIGHATVLIEMDGVRLLTDPLLRDRVGPIRRQSAEFDLDWCHGLDAVLISHTHLDHLDLASLRLLGYSVRLIVPRGIGTILRWLGFQRVEELRAGEATMVGSLKVQATYAYHPGPSFFFGATTDPLGFIIDGGSCVYFAGDTDLFPEMAMLADDIDVALLPVWGWGPTLRNGHMDPRRAAESLSLLRPRWAVPIHWGTFCPVGIGWMRPRFLTQPPHEFAYHAAHLAPEVKVCIVEPGEFTRLEK